MTGAAMAALIVANLKAIDPSISGAMEAKLLARWTAICNGIIAEIIANAVTSTTVAGGSSAGTHPGTVVS